MNSRWLIIEFATQVKVATTLNVSRRSRRGTKKRRAKSDLSESETYDLLQSETSNFGSVTEEDALDVKQVSPERKVTANPADRIQSCESHLGELCTQAQ